MTATLEAALEQRATTPGTRARRTLASLQTALGYVVLAGTSANPTWIRVARMEGHSHWRHLSGRGQGAMFEQEEVGHG